MILIVTRSPLECHPARYAVSPERHPHRYLISTAAYSKFYVNLPKVFLIVMWSHMGRSPKRDAVSPGALSCPLLGTARIVILTVTWSSLEHRPARYAVSPERRPDRYLISPAAYHKRYTRSFPDLDVVSHGATS